MNIMNGVMESVRTRTIPEWGVGLIKFVATVLCAVAIGYARFVGLESKVAENRNDISEIKAHDSNQSELLNAISGRINTVEITTRMNDESIKASLGRIEMQIKEVRSDMREIQQKGNP